MPKGDRLGEINAAQAENLRAKQLQNYEVIKSGCWIWQGGVSPDGYGKVKRFGKTIRAHRLFYEHYKGKIPQGLWVLHNCDEPRCVNPEHLWLGTQKDNEADKDRKGRRPPSPSITHPHRLCRGDNHPSKRPEYRAMMSGDNNPMKREDVRSKFRGVRPTNAKFTSQQIAQIRKDARSTYKIAKDLGVSQSTIFKIKTEKRYTTTMEVI